MKVRYEEMKAVYTTPPIFKTDEMDVQLISEIVSQLNNGKAAGLDGLSAEHLKNSHPILIVIMCKLFNLFVKNEYIPGSFGISYTVPIPKQDGRSHSLSVNDFRGISISPVISKVFEHAILNRFCDYFNTSDHSSDLRKMLVVAMQFVVSEMLLIIM